MLTQEPDSLDRASDGRLYKLAFALVLLGAFSHIAIYLQPFEDSFITYRYARNVARGLGFVFNPGERVEGYTSFLWTVILAGVHALGGSMMWVSQALSAAFGLSIVHLGSRLLPLFAAPGFQAARAPLLVRLAPSIWLASTGTLAYYAMTGMETTMFSWFVLASALVLSREELTRQHALLAGVLLALGALSRPEGLGYALCVVFALVLFKKDRMRGLETLFAFACVFVPYFAWRYSYFGFWAPNTYYAKAAASRALLVQGAAYLEGCLVGRGLLLPVLALGLVTLRRFEHRPTRIAGAIVGGALVNTVIVGGDIFLFYRFLLPAMPFAYAGLATLIAERTALATKGTRIAGSLLVAAFAAGLVMTELVPVSTFSRARTQSDLERAHGNADIVYGYFAVGSFLRGNVDPSALIATNAAGVVPYESDLPTIDMLGLTDVHIAHAPIELGHGTLGHEKYDADYVLSRKPDLIFLGLPTIAPANYGPSDIERWNKRTLAFLAGDRALLKHPKFQNEYQPLYLRTPAGPLFVYLRKGRESVLR